VQYVCKIRFKDLDTINETLKLKGVNLKESQRDDHETSIYIHQKVFHKNLGFYFFFFGMPYEEQAKKLNWDEKDAAFRGPHNPKSKKTYYRANKVSKK